MADANKESPKKLKKKTASDETQLLYLVTKYFKLAGVTLAVWFVGWTKFSPSWLLLGLVLYLWKERHVKQRHRRMKMMQQIAENEKEVILATVEDLPSWVHFPDRERAEWFNQIIDQVWPFIGDYVRDLLMTSIQEKIQTSHAQAASFKFLKIDLGDIPPRIGSIKVNTKNVKRDEIYMDIDLMYGSDADIEMRIKGMTMGIKDLHVRGELRVIMRPLISRMPLFGGISVFFLNNPTLDFNLTGIANAIDMPGLSDMVDTIIQEQIAALMVLPNRIDVPMVQDLASLARLKYPLPDGVLRIHVVGAKELIKADVGLMKKGLSDPYAVVRMGAYKFKTHVINNTIEPTWNSIFETIVDAKDGQLLDIEVRDEDPGSKDDSIGTTSLPISTAAEKGTEDTWLPLEDVKTGRINLKLEWMYLSKNALILEKTIKEMELRNKLSDDLSCCLLMVNLDSARELPYILRTKMLRAKKTMSEPSPYVKLSLGQSKFESGIKADTDEPRWEQNFRFLVHNPNLQTLELEVWESKSKTRIGNLKVPLKNLLVEPDLIVDKFYNLVNSPSPKAQVRMRLCLRVLTSEYNQADIEEEEEEETPVETLESKESSVDPVAQQSATPADKTAKAGPAVVKKVEVVKVEKVNKVSSKLPEGQLIPPMDSSTPIKDSDVRQRKSPSNQGGLYGRGRIQITLRYSTQRQNLVAVVHKCVNLIPCDTDDNLADPYIKMYLLPDKSNKKKTTIIKNTLNPVWDETFEFPVKQADLSSKTLEFSIKNDTSFYTSNKKFIGIAQIELGNMDQTKAATHWFDLQPDEDDCKPVSLPSETDL
ncbi:extended synaptotagmin-2-like isoform X2 [Mytilus edulis]|uniref:extended synaptotagmin-2-like isoform X2 n=1 Tax=Mytilus edulis TaxID=6550 RepID=UPI0039F0F595